MLTLLEMMEAGVHFGHKKERSHPKAKNYIFTLREGMFVLDLEKTQLCLQEAINFLKKEVSFGKTILFIGTKRQAKEQVKKIAENTGMLYINKRFLGGTLTNFETIRKNIMNMENLENKMNSPEFEVITKKEKKIISDKYEKLKADYEGIRNMKKLPDVVFIIDANHEQVAIAECIKMEIPVVAITDSDANPDRISYPIFANDDAPKSIDLILSEVEKELGGNLQEAKVQSAQVEEKEKEVVKENMKEEKTEKKSKIKPKNKIEKAGK